MKASDLTNIYTVGAYYYGLNPSRSLTVVGSGGNLNIYGGGGSGHEYWSGMPGGGSFFGGAGATGHPRGGHYAYNHQYRAAPGSGGSPGYHTSRRGARGMAGIVCVWNFR